MSCQKTGSLSNTFAVSTKIQQNRRDSIPLIKDVATKFRGVISRLAEELILGSTIEIQNENFEKRLNKNNSKKPQFNYLRVHVIFSRRLVISEKIKNAQLSQDVPWTSIAVAQISRFQRS